MSITGIPSRIGYALAQARQMMRASSNRRSPLQAGHTRIAFSSSSIMGFPFTAGAKPLEREPEALVHVDPGFPAERSAGARDVGLPDLRVVCGKRAKHDLA